METTKYDTIQSRARSVITLPAMEALAVPSYVTSTALMIHHAGNASQDDVDLVVGYDHDAAIRENEVAAR